MLEDFSFYNLSIDDIYNICNEMNHEKKNGMDICEECFMPFLKNGLLMGTVKLTDDGDKQIYEIDMNNQ